MDYYEKFYNDLEGGELGEKIIGEYFNNLGYKVEPNLNKNADFDIKIHKDNKVISLEIKTDNYYLKRRTNNMVFEVSCNNKPSGLNSTKADYYIYYFPEEKIAYMASISKIKSIIPQCRTTYGGDGMRAKLYLVDRTEWGKEFKIIKIN